MPGRERKYKQVSVVKLHARKLREGLWKTGELESQDKLRAFVKRKSWQFDSISPTREASWIIPVLIIPFISGRFQNISRWQEICGSSAFS
jgi:hypothetical protein